MPPEIDYCCVQNSENNIIILSYFNVNVFYFGEVKA